MGAFIKLSAGSRLKNYMGLEMETGTEYVHGKNYVHLDIPLSPGTDVDVKRNQHLFIPAACHVTVRGRDILYVEPNPALAEYGQVQSGYYIHPDSGRKKLGTWFTAHKGLDLTTIDYVVRLYMIE